MARSPKKARVQPIMIIKSASCNLCTINQNLWDLKSASCSEDQVEYGAHLWRVAGLPERWPEQGGQDQGFLGLRLGQLAQLWSGMGTTARSNNMR